VTAVGDLSVLTLIKLDPELALVCAVIVLWSGLCAGLIAWVFSDPPRRVAEPSAPPVPPSDEYLLDVAESVEVVRRG
jgi:hypothetical protein